MDFQPFFFPVRAAQSEKNIPPITGQYTNKVIIDRALERVHKKSYFNPIMQSACQNLYFSSI